MHKLESVQENETHKILWNFEIQTDHLISVRKSGLIFTKKKKKKEFVILLILRFQRPQIESKRKWKDKHLDLARELKTTMEREGDSDINCSWHIWNGL